jgi:leader peptidase (prepilin peptidase)/N-methyltransferase
LTPLASFGAHIEVLLGYGWLVLALVAWVGLSVGSFLNVVIHRLPVMLERLWRGQAHEVLALAPAAVEPSRFDLIAPRSRCPSCHAPIRARHNVPVLSWLWLRGRCASCRVLIPVRYPLVELFTGLCTLIVVATFGYTWTAAAALGFTWTLIAAAFIDYDTKLLPDGITLPLLWAGLAVNLAGTFTDLPSAVTGAIAGYLVLWLVYWAFKLATKKEGMGYGDFKLLAALGAWLGWQSLPVLVLVSSFAGVIIGGGVMLLRRQREPMPFGPFLAIAGFVTLLGRDTFVGLVFR